MKNNPKKKETEITIEKGKSITLSSQTKIGLTFGQIIMAIGLLGSMMGAFVDLNSRIVSLELKTEQLSKSGNQTDQVIETIRTENREDHQRIEAKMDMLIDRLYVKK